MYSKPTVIKHGGKKLYMGAGLKGFGLRGRGPWGSLFKNIGKSLLSTGKSVLKNAAKELVPLAVNTLGNKALEFASTKGAPDALVNIGSQLLQKGTQAVDKALPAQEKIDVSGVISNAGQDILAQLMQARKGKGLRNFGGGLAVQQAPRV